MSSARLTPKEAEWLRCVVETFCNVQEDPEDERIRQSACHKLMLISKGRKKR